MSTRTITPNLVQITRLHFVNAYLVREDDGLTLIDSTFGGGAAQALIDAAKGAGAEIRRIAVTHGHGDHVGGVPALKERLGADVELLIPELDARILAGEKVVEGKLPGMWPKNFPVAPDTRINGGDRVGSLEVVDTPGHTPGHVAFRDTRDNTVIAGDVFTAYGRLEVTNHFNLRFPLAFGATWDKQKDSESARAIRALDPSWLAVGHGPALKDPGPAIDEAIARAGR